MDRAVRLIVIDSIAAPARAGVDQDRLAQERQKHLGRA